jgi:hypothetical protein
LRPPRSNVLCTESHIRMPQPVRRVSAKNAPSSRNQKEPHKEQPHIHGRLSHSSMNRISHSSINSLDINTTFEKAEFCLCVVFDSLRDSNEVCATSMFTHRCYSAGNDECPEVFLHHTVGTIRLLRRVHLRCFVAGAARVVCVCSSRSLP